ncbi:MAG: DUF5672 family protein [Psychroflexus sp.]
MSSSCKIVVPIYKNHLTHNEKISFQNLSKFYNPDKLAIVCPEGLKLDKLVNHIQTIRFDKVYFKNIDGYNKLMKSIEFYENFEKYNYILIHQLDTYIFKDELERWCSENYDYIGAPWLKSNNPFSSLFQSKKKKSRKPTFLEVGNGGFSLRKTSTFINFLNNHKDIVDEYSEDPLYKIEDVFWSLIAPKYVDFKKPDYLTAALFAIDRKPKLGFKITKGKLPFGCHGFEKDKTKPFWKSYIENLK